MSQPIDPNQIVIFSGAGISAESGLATFRDMDGLWNQYKIEDVATPSAWESNPERVLQFYNERRRQATSAQPNVDHLAIAELETNKKPFGYNCWQEKASIAVPSVVRRWLKGEYLGRSNN